MSSDLYSRLTSGSPAILLIDDDRNILDTAKDILEDAKYAVTTAGTGKEALEKLDQQAFNVVVADFQLPDATGLELARKVRERNEDTCVILMTGHASLEMAVRAIQEAVYDYLIKPVDPAQLRRTIEKAIEKQRLSLENKQLLEDLQKTNAAIARLDTLKSKMLKLMSHDLRTPLTSIRGYAELLKSGVKGRLTEAQKQMMDITMQEADHLNGLIGDLLDLASIEAGRLMIDLSPMPFEAVMQKAVPRVKMIADMKEIKIDVSMATPLPTVNVDMHRLVQMISNMIRGSIKRSARGGRVYVHAFQQNGQVEVKISQAGQGYTAEELKSLTDWAKPAPGADVGENQDSARIALGIAREIVHAHHGELGVESSGVDQGSTMWIRLPIAKSE